jgi:hypothetical protein
MSSNFIHPKQTVYQNVIRHDVKERDNWSQAPPSAIQPYIPAASTSTHTEEYQEARAKRNRNKLFHNGLAKHFNALAKHFKALEIAHTEKALCHERMLQDYVLRYEKEVQHDESFDHVKTGKLCT